MKILRTTYAKPSRQSGFTLMEILVATTIFVSVLTVMMTLLSLTLRTYRRVEAQRQIAQSVRTTMEYIAKEVRNGEIDYSVQDGAIIQTPIAPCPAPTVLGGDTYTGTDRIGIINVDGERECIYWQHDTNLGAEDAQNNNILLKRDGVASTSQLNPPNVKIKELRFYIRPRRDPYNDVGGLVQAQPVVTIVALVSIRLPTGELRTISYQTSVASHVYDIPGED